MKRYLIFAAVGPFFGGLLLLFATTVASGYWTETNWSEVETFFVTFAKTLQYSYLLGVMPALMLGAIDDILVHVRKIGPLVRMLIVGAAGFVAGELLHGQRPGQRRGAVHPPRPLRLHARDDLIVAGAQIFGTTAGGHFDIKGRLETLVW